TDHTFIERVLSTKYPGKQLSLFNAATDNRTKEVLHIVKTLLGDLQKSPYQDRIFVVLDQTHSSGLVDTIAKMGLPRDNVIVWSKNGIEHYYPKDILRKIFNGEGELKMAGDVIELNGVHLTKNELVERVVPSITETTA